MFSVMFFYNLFLNGRLGHMTWLEGVLTYVIGFAITLLIEMCIVGPSAKSSQPFCPKRQENLFYSHSFYLYRVWDGVSHVFMRICRSKHQHRISNTIDSI